MKNKTLETNLMACNAETLTALTGSTVAVAGGYGDVPVQSACDRACLFLYSECSGRRLRCTFLS